MKRTTEENRYYNRGVIEGYLNVSLENLNNVSSNLVIAYDEGKQYGAIKLEKALTEETIDILSLQTRRTKYIETIGQLVATQNYPATPDNLSSEDQDSFYYGYAEGEKQNKMQNISADDYLEAKRQRK